MLLRLGACYNFVLFYSTNHDKVNGIKQIDALEAIDDRLASSNSEAPKDRKHPDLVIAIVLACVNFAFLLVCWRTVGVQADESVNIYGALRILEGEYIYRDFWVYNTPGIFFWTAAMFLVLGKSLLAVRLALIVTASATSSALYLLGRKFMGTLWALIPPLLFIAVGVNLWPVGGHHWYSTLILVFCVLSTARFVENRSRITSLFFGGCLAGLTFLFQQPKGGMLLALVFLFLVADSVFRKNDSHKPGPLRTASIFAAGAVTPLFIALFYFVLTGTLRDALSATIVVPFRLLFGGGGGGQYTAFYGALTRRAITGIAGQFGTSGVLGWAALTVVFLINYAVPLAIPLLVLLWVIRRLRTGSGNPVAVLCSLAALAALMPSLQKPDFHHLLSTSAPGYVALAGVLSFLGMKGKGGKWSLARKASAILLAVILMISCMSLAAADLLYASRIRMLQLGSPLGFIPVPGSAGEVRGMKHPIMSVIDFIQFNTRPDQRIFVMSFSPFIYYLSDRKNATEYVDIPSSPCGQGALFHVLKLGKASANLERLENAANELEADRTPLIVLDPAASCQVRDEAAASLYAGDPLVEYIREHYRIEADYGEYVVMRRID